MSNATIAEDNAIAFYKGAAAKRERLPPDLRLLQEDPRRPGVLPALESYTRDNSEAEFSHGICPECTEKHYGDILRGKR